MDDASHNSHLFRSEFLDIRDRIKELLDGSFCSNCGGVLDDDDDDNDVEELKIHHPRKNNHNKFFAPLPAVAVPNIDENESIIIFDSPNAPPQVRKVVPKTTRTTTPQRQRQQQYLTSMGQGGGRRG